MSKAAKKVARIGRVRELRTGEGLVEQKGSVVRAAGQLRRQAAENRRLNKQAQEVARRFMEGVVALGGERLEVGHVEAAFGVDVGQPECPVYLDLGVQARNGSVVQTRLAEDEARALLHFLAHALGA